MEFRVLGPLQVRAHGDRVPLPGARRQRLLAGLLAAPNSAVPIGRLIEKVFESEPPGTAVKQVENSVSALRERLHDSERRLIVTEEADYRICVGEDQLDSLKFAALLADSRRHAADGRLESAIGMIRSALALWRGPALDGLGGSALSGRAARLDEQRLGALELCARWRLEGGQHQEVVDELSDLVPSHPLREGLHAQLITALDRCGRRAEALHAFHRLGTSLAQELGVGPGAGLQRLHEQILSGQSPSSWPPRPRRDDAVRTATPLPAPRLPSTTTAPPAPRQLPHAIRDFTGRTDHLAALDAALLRRAVMSPVAVRRWRSPRSTARAAWERRPSRCTGPNGSSTGSPTERSAQTCAGTGPAGPRPRRGPRRLPRRARRPSLSRTGRDRGSSGSGRTPGPSSFPSSPSTSRSASHLLDERDRFLGRALIGTS